MLIRFIGSKTHLLPNIEACLDRHVNGTEKTFVDLFAGSNCVGQHFKPRYRIVSNDLLYSSVVTAKATIVNNRAPSFVCLKKHGVSDPLRYLNNYNLKGYQGGYITDHYSLEGQRMYFQVKNAKRIDFIRTKIRQWHKQELITEPEFYYLLNALIQAVPFVSNITGTYSAYLKNWDKRAYKDLHLYPYHIVNNGKHNVAYHTDSLELARKLHGDIVYIDTPYNSRQYAPNYHILETVALYDNPKIHGKTGMRDYRDEKSTFSMKRKAETSMRQLLHHLDFHHVIISYSTDGIISLGNMERICQHEAEPGTFKLYRIPYRKYKSKIVHKSRLYELLFYFQPKYYWATHRNKLNIKTAHSQKLDSSKRKENLCGTK